MRKVSTLVVAGLAVAGLGTMGLGTIAPVTLAFAQDINFSTSQNVQPLLGTQAPAEFRVSPAAPPAGFADTSRSKVELPTMAGADGAMTAPAAPGSGASLGIQITPDAAMTVSERSAFAVAQPATGFSTADGQTERALGGVQPLLGFNTTTSLTTSFTPDASMTPSRTLGQ